MSNTLNMDLLLTQKLDFLTKGLSVEVKGAYNTTYSFEKRMIKRAARYRSYTAYYRSELGKSGNGFYRPKFQQRDCLFG